jgi:hypothetical protein
MPQQSIYVCRRDDHSDEQVQFIFKKGGILYDKISKALFGADDLEQSD